VELIIDSDFLISVAVKIKVLGFPDLPEKMQSMEEFLNHSSVLPLNEEVTNKTITLRRLHKKLRLGDAIIAATALVYNLTLLTRNLSDFKNIPELRLIDPHSL